MGWKCPTCRKYVEDNRCSNCESVSLEDELTARIIELRKRPDTTFSTEVHYDYYSNRGVVDLIETEIGLVSPMQVEASVGFWGYEIKSPAAISAATGANEITRQFNRHRDYFLKGSDHRGPSSSQYPLKWFLVFGKNQTSIRHLKDNYVIYENLNSKEDVEIAILHPHGELVNAFTGGLEDYWSGKNQQKTLEASEAM